MSMTPTFRCAGCDKPRLATGRKLLRVMGLKTWVCAECAARRAKA